MIANHNADADTVFCMTGNATSSGYRERNSTADRAIDILLMFGDDRPTTTAIEVADLLGVSRSTAYRYLQSLLSSGLLEEDTGRFRLGPRTLDLARIARKGIGLSEIARPCMRRLCAQVGETVLLTRPAGAAVVCLEREEPAHPIRLSYDRGQILPLNAGASATVIMAWMPEEDLDTLLASASFEKFTNKTVTDPQRLRARVRSIRKQGYAVSRGELDPDVLGVAAPIFSANTAVAAISVAALSHRVPDQRLPEVVAAVREAAGLISERLTLVES
jgi:DNA-binding IclR family transcriptional regulator